MKYISIDIETTGLNPENCQLLSLGAIIEDTEKKLPYEDCPKFYGIVNHDYIFGEPFALNMNKDIIAAIAKYNKAKSREERKEIEEFYNAIFYQEKDILHYLHGFLLLNGFDNTAKLVAGANFAFDRSFLSRYRGYDKLNLGRRPLEPSHYTINWKEDKIMPSLFQCKERLGLEGGISHHALEDAWDVIQVLRTQY